ncbi:MAG: penicillin-binding transpeptidase domain-containing protein, partial [Candidatus Omnitrophica bacterium]|nr:penicillin-binding transpeptidase domain-containing protein [Candidatus Omnitrophota bacterium]
MYFPKKSLRFILLFLFCLSLFIFFGAKLILIQVFRSSFLTNLAEKQQTHIIRLNLKRGTIYDRKMRPLALDIVAYSLYADPRMMRQKDIEKAIEILPSAAGLDRGFLLERLGRDKNFVWLARKLSPEAEENIKKFKIKGLGVVKESRRRYPGQSSAAHILGFAGMDNNGLEGLELKYNNVLVGRVGVAQMLRDARQQDLLIEQNLVEPQDGFDLVLTIDENIQYFAERALDKGFAKHRPLSASLIVMNPKTGEILALANRPTYDLNEFDRSSESLRKNRAVVDMYEPGSVFKIVTASAALEKGVFKETDKIFCENGQYQVANHMLHDHQRHGILTFRGVIEQSSNIGVTKIAQKLGGQSVYEYAIKFGFAKKTDIDLLGEISGSLKSPRFWSATSIGAVPIGHEVGVTTIQLVCAISAIANDGVLMKPFVVKEIRDNKGEMIETFSPKVVRQAIEPATAKRMKDILIGVIETGTGKLAKMKD